MDCMNLEASLPQLGPQRLTEKETQVITSDPSAAMAVQHGDDTAPVVDSYQSVAPYTPSTDDDVPEPDVAGQAEAAPKKGSIPLPSPLPPSTPVLPRVAAGLVQAGVISAAVLSEVRRHLDAGEQLQAAECLLLAWAEADDKGIRAPGAPQVFQPDTQRFPGLKPSPMRPDNLLLMCADEQAEVVQYLLTGFTEGFVIAGSRDQPLVFESVEHPNGNFATEAERRAIAKTMAKEAELGRTGVWPKGLEPRISSPVFPVAKRSDGQPVLDNDGEQKYRQAHDLSKGNAQHKSVNDYIPPEDRTIQYESVQTAVDHIFRIRREAVDQERHRLWACLALLNEAAVSDHLTVFESRLDLRATINDAEAAFRIMPLHPSAYGMLGYTDLEGVQRFESRLCFGLANAPRMYSAFSNLIAWLLRYVFGIRAVVCYLDDFLTISLDRAESVRASRVVDLVFRILNVPMAQDKRDWRDAPQTVFLGVGLDLPALAVSITPGRLANLVVRVTEWSTRTTASCHDLQELAGHLGHASRVLGVGRMFLNRIHAAIAYALRNDAAKGYRGQVRLGVEFHKDMRWWSEFLVLFNNRARMVDTSLPLEWDGEAYTDAAGWGGGGVLVPTFWQVPWSGPLAFMADQHINVREAWCLPTMLMMPHAAPSWKGKRIRLWCDNQVVVHCAQGQKSKNEWILHYCRVLWMLEALYEFTLDVQYIPTHLNIADLPSRVPASMVLQDPRCSHFAKLLPVLWVPPLPTDPSWERKMAQQVRLVLEARR